MKNMKKSSPCATTVEDLRAMVAGLTDEDRRATLADLKAMLADLRYRCSGKDGRLSPIGQSETERINRIIERGDYRK